MKKLLVTIALTISLNAWADKRTTYYGACMDGYYRTAGELVPDASHQRKYQGASSTCATLQTMIDEAKDSKNGWTNVASAEFQGCVDGVDSALGKAMAPEVRKQFKLAICN